MKRREQEQTGPVVPGELVEFDPGVWPSVAAWIGARKEWAVRNGWPGDPVEFVREHARAKRRRVVG